MEGTKKKKEDEIPLFMKSISEMTPEELDQKIESSKRGSYTFKFAKKEEDRFKPNNFGKAPMILSDEIIGGRYSAADGKMYESRSEWRRSLEMAGIEMMPYGTKPPPRKIDRVSDQEYIDTVKEAERLVDWNEVHIDEKEREDNKQIREAMLNKYGTKEERKPSNRKKIIEGK